MEPKKVNPIFWEKIIKNSEGPSIQNRIQDSEDKVKNPFRKSQSKPYKPSASPENKRKSEELVSLVSPEKKIKSEDQLPSTSSENKINSEYHVPSASSEKKRKFLGGKDGKRISSDNKKFRKMYSPKEDKVIYDAVIKVHGSAYGSGLTGKSTWERIGRYLHGKCLLKNRSVSSLKTRFLDHIRKNMKSFEREPGSQIKTFRRIISDSEEESEDLSKGENNLDNDGETDGIDENEQDSDGETDGKDENKQDSDGEKDGKDGNKQNSDGETDGKDEIKQESDGEKDGKDGNKQNSDGETDGKDENKQDSDGETDGIDENKQNSDGETDGKEESDGEASEDESNQGYDGKDHIENENSQHSDSQSEELEGNGEGQNKTLKKTENCEDTENNIEQHEIHHAEETTQRKKHHRSKKDYGKTTVEKENEASERKNICDEEKREPNLGNRTQVEDLKRADEALKPLKKFKKGGKLIEDQGETSKVKKEEKKRKKEEIDIKLNAKEELKTSKKEEKANKARLAKVIESKRVKKPGSLIEDQRKIEKTAHKFHQQLQSASTEASMFLKDLLLRSLSLFFNGAKQHINDSSAPMTSSSFGVEEIVFLLNCIESHDPCLVEAGRISRRSLVYFCDRIQKEEDPNY